MGYFNRKFIAIDNTSDATYRTWGKAISDEIAASGWVQQNDTGQPVWTQTTFNISQVTHSGSNNVYTYSGLAGPALRIGMSVVIVGCTTGANNGTFTITALGGGTFTVANGAGVTEAVTATGSTTLSTRPSTNTYRNEVWAPADSLQTGGTAFYFVVQYGCGNAQTNPTLRFAICTSTDGAGVPTGITSGNLRVPNQSNMPSSTTPSYSIFSGDVNRFCFRSFIDREFIVNVERTKATDGTDSSDGVVIVTHVGSSPNADDFLTTVVFGIGVSHFGNAAGGGSVAPTPWGVNSGYTSQIFNNQIALWPVFPVYGKFANPLLGLVQAYGGDIPAGVLFRVTAYGSTVKYHSKACVSVNQGNIIYYHMRYD